MSEGDDYRRRFRECGEGVVIEPGVWIEHPENFIVGDRVRFRRGFYVKDPMEEVRIGSDVSFYPNVFIQGRGRLVVGDRVDFFPNNYLSICGEGSFIEVGSHTHFAPGCALYGHHGLSVGEHCACSANVVLATIGHDPRTQGLLVKSAAGAPIVLERDVWVGANATVLPGVRIREGCVVGAGAVATADTEPFGIYLGMPARRAATRKRDE